MKQIVRLTILFFACAALVLTAVAGPEPISGGKEMKQVAPAPSPECNWTGFYIGLNVGGQFGHSETFDLDHFDFNRDNGEWGYSESGVVASGQLGYNFQWNRIVIGPEFDLGYMNLEGSANPKPDNPVFNGNRGETDSDFYTTMRGRIGFTLDCWLIYATGGAIGVNYSTRMIDDCNTGPCGPFLINTSRTDFEWGYTVGGGVERLIGRHWSLKADYLFFALDKQDFSGFETGVGVAAPFHFQAKTEGHIVRAGLNFHF